MAAARHYILATAGHVDHGKSALVKALTGTDPDRLPEEKLRGITIDLGFAHLLLPHTKPSNAPFLVGIVDVPGHEDFVKNMVAGVGSIDLALLVVAADDGWMPQTEEHLQILEYLGVRRGLIALTKIDLAEDVDAAQALIRGKLAGTRLADAPIIPTSVITGAGLQHLKSAIGTVLEETPPLPDIGKPRLPVDRVFKLQGVGTVVTGTLTGGMLRRGQTVVVQPSGKKARIRTIQSHNREVEQLGPGTRTALNLPDFGADADVHRGDIVTLEALGGPCAAIEVELQTSHRAGRALKNYSRVRVHHGSSDVPAQVVLLAGDDLPIGHRSVAHLRFERPSFLFVGDRFIIRDWAEQNTLAGGVVLDLDAERGSLRDEARVRLLYERAQKPNSASAFVASEVAFRGCARRSNLFLASHFGAQAVAEAVSELAAQSRIVLSGEFLFDVARWSAVRSRMIAAIDAYHFAHPEQGGPTIGELRAAFELQEEVPELFEPIIADLAAGDFLRAGPVIRRKTHRPALSGQLREAGARLRAALGAKPLDPPSRSELAPDSTSQQALRFLIDSGEVVEINADIVMLTDTLHEAKDRIRHFIRTHGAAAAGELRQALGTSRRVVIPLLERLDREGVTVRQNDRRILRT